MTTFGYAEMRDWAEQSDDPRVRSMWERLSNCRSKIAKWCQAAEYAELRTKNLAAENAALRAEVERLDERFDAVRDAAHAEAKRVFPATVIESHIGGELHADDLCSMLAAEVERLREERRWRTFPANLPDANGRYVCMWADGDVYIQRWEGSKWLGAFDHEITHWQPLPAPPGEEE